MFLDILFNPNDLNKWKGSVSSFILFIWIHDLPAMDYESAEINEEGRDHFNSEEFRKLPLTSDILSIFRTLPKFYPISNKRIMSELHHSYTPHKIKTYLSELVSFGLIEIQHAGLPKTRYIRVPGSWLDNFMTPKTTKMRKS